MARELLCLLPVIGHETGSRARQRGVTLVEVSLIAAATAMTAGTLWVVAGPGASTDQHLAALRDADEIREAAIAWQSENRVGCPSLTQLKRDRHLSEDAESEDPWGGRFRLICQDAKVTIRSPGPDHKLETDDDIRLTAE
jgi:hypothetical protein